MKVIVDLTAVNFSVPTWKKRNKVIILHSMDGTYNGTISWFRNKDSQGSTQYLISKTGEIRQMVKDEHISFNCRGMTSDYGEKAYWNDISLSIELEDDKLRDKYVYPQEQIDALIWLCDFLCAKYDIPQDAKHILLHKNLDPGRRSDPVGNFDLNWILLTNTTQGENPMSTQKDDKWYRNNYWNYLYNFGLSLIGPIVNVIAPEGVADDEAKMKEYSTKVVNEVALLKQKYDIASDRAATAETLHTGAVEREARLSEDNRKLNQANDLLELEIKKLGEDIDMQKLTIKALEGEIATYQANQKFDWSKFGSRKFISSVIATSISMGNYIFNWGLDLNEIMVILSPLLAYIGVEGIRDIRDIPSKKPDEY